MRAKSYLRIRILSIFILVVSVAQLVVAQTFDEEEIWIDNVTRIIKGSNYYEIIYENGYADLVYKEISGQVFLEMEYLEDDNLQKRDVLGAPATPFKPINLQIPQYAQIVESFIVDIDYNYIDLPHLYIPYQDRFESGDSTFSYFQCAYNAQYTEDQLLLSSVELSESYVYRNTSGVFLTINPFLYNPALGYGFIVNSIVYRIYFSESFEDMTDFNDFVTLKNFYDTDPLFFNEEDEDEDEDVEYRSLDPGLLMIVSLDNYVSMLDDFVDHKESLGYTVEVIPASAIESSDYISASSLKFFLSTYEEYPYKTKYLLLVGSPYQIEYSQGVANNSENPATDRYYSILYPESNNTFIVGRWPVRSETELTNIMYKTIYYEDIILDFNKEDLYIALFSGSGDGESQFAQNIEDISYALEEKQFYNRGCYFGPDYNNTEAACLLYDTWGLDLWSFIYRGHGAPTFLGPPYSMSSIYSMDYGNYAPLAFMFACNLNGSSSVSNGYSFGERLLTLSEEYGTVSSFASTTVSYRGLNNEYSKLLFNLLSQDFQLKLGDITNAAAFKFLGQNPSLNRVDHVNKYVLFGDPSLFLYGSHHWGDIQYSPAEKSVNVVYNKELKQLSIENNETFTLIIYDINGHIIQKCTTNNYNVSSLASGFYLAHIVTPDAVTNYKFFVNN